MSAHQNATRDIPKAELLKFSIGDQVVMLVDDEKNKGIVNAILYTANGYKYLVSWPDAEDVFLYEHELETPPSFT